jgi:anti-anti-sigma factor
VADLLRIEEGEEPGSFVLVGELDISNAPQLAERFKNELRRAGRLTLDTRGLSFMDSQGLRLLIDLGVEASQRDAAVTVLNCPPQVRRLLDISIPDGIPGVEIVEAEA